MGFVAPRGHGSLIILHFLSHRAEIIPPHFLFASIKRRNGRYKFSSFEKVLASH
jgi:hypothetical protein